MANNTHKGPKFTQEENHPLDVFVGSFLNIFTWPAFGLMLLGIAIGFVLGILPGLNDIAGLALLIPFVVDMGPNVAFAFLLGMSAVAATGGDITSILFGVPGESTSAATLLDGYPLARRGEAGRALGASIFSSALGGLIGAAALGLSIPIIRPFVLLFGPPELLMLTLMGLTFIVSLGSRSKIKGFLMGGFGLMLSMVGLDRLEGIPRYTLGQVYLWDGVPIVPTLLGLFAVPTILDLMVSRSSIATTGRKNVSGVLEGAIEAFRNWWLITRCSLIGVLIGIIPGIGAGVAQWVGYGHAKQTSKHPEEFGSGSLEAVIASSSVDNAALGGILIPTVAFGVPGGAAMTVLLSAFLILGLVPGPDMLTKNVDVTYTMVWTIAIANVLGAVLGLAVLGHLARITLVKGTLLAPFLLLFVLAGSYAAQHSLGDVAVMLLFGILGWACQRWDWPRPPLILTLVLGRIAEGNLFLSQQLYGWAWIGKPIVVVLGLIILMALVMFRPKRREKPGQVPEAQAGASGGRVDPQVVVTALLVLAAAWGIVAALNWPAKARIFPLVVAVPVLAGSLLQLAADLRLLPAGRIGAATRTEPPIGRNGVVSESVCLENASLRDTAVVLAQFLAFFAGTYLFGLLVAGPLYALGYLRYGSRESWRRSGVLAAVLWLVTWVVLEKLLLLRFPNGLLDFLF